MKPLAFGGKQQRETGRSGVDNRTTGSGSSTFRDRTLGSRYGSRTEKVGVHTDTCRQMQQVFACQKTEIFQSRRCDQRNHRIVEKCSQKVCSQCNARLRQGVFRLQNRYRDTGSSILFLPPRFSLGTSDK